MSHPLPSRATLQPIAHRAMIERGLEPDFPPAALAETKALARAASETGPQILDRRGLLWCSIDNDDSRDLDQLSVSVPGAGGVTRILVAVADVDASVKKGSELDEHAAHNTTSVYTAAEIFPMLPEKLSTDLTSLGERQERLAIVAELTVAADGVVTGFEIYRAHVLNRAKLAYDSVSAWLDGKAPAPRAVTLVPGMEEQLRTQDRVAQAMKKVRHHHGALTLETIEAHAVFRGDALADLRREDRNRAKELIEDFMVAANGAIAKFLEKKQFPSLRRVLRSPERWDRIVQLAATVGGHLPAEPSAVALEQLLTQRRAADPAGFADFSLSVVKLLGKGEYVVEVPGQRHQGHFGLAVKDYAQATAPNRRFPDLLTQRLVKAALAGRPVPYTNAELDTIARHCTQQEDNAAKVERQVRKSAAALLLADRVGETFDAIVTGRNERGFWVRITSPVAEGKLTGGSEGYDVGDHLRVVLERTDVERGFIDFVRARTS